MPDKPPDLVVDAADQRDELLGLIRETPAENLNVLSWFRILQEFRAEMALAARYLLYDEEMRRIVERNAAARWEAERAGR